MMLLTEKRSRATHWPMKKVITLAIAASVSACGGCVQVQAPDKPIEINLNVNIRQEVVLSLKKDVDALINDNAELFPK
jgi:YnbE-like lipoprotein